MRGRLTPWLGLVIATLLMSGTAKAQVQKDAILKEIQAAFTTWEQISCSKLKFKFAGELDSFATQKEGAILVYFGWNSDQWVYAKDAYHVSGDWKLKETGEITSAVIGLNALEHWWSIGKDSSKQAIDIQTAILHMIPRTIGFYVGDNPKTGSLSTFVQYGLINHSLDPLHRTAVQYLYFDETQAPKDGSTGCVKPARPPICDATLSPDGGISKDLGALKDFTSVKDIGVLKDLLVLKDKQPVAKDGTQAKDIPGAQPDAGPPIQMCIGHTVPNNPDKEGKPLHWGTLPIPYYVYITNGKLPGCTGDGCFPPADAGIKDLGPKACTKDSECDTGLTCQNGFCKLKTTDSGCCRVSHAGSENTPLGVLLIAGILLLFARRYRRR
jgi:hypothetical protein